MYDLEEDGLAFADIVLSPSQCDHIASSLPSASGAGRASVRNLISHPTVVRILHHERLGSYLWSVVGRDLVAVRATLFDKTSDANWRVQWHQDRAIAVRERLQVKGYGPWSTKLGTVQVEPPAEVLSQMIIVRVHLDQCGSDRVPLCVLPGSHRAGKLNPEQIAEVVAATPVEELTASQGSLLLMRPLLVHSSPPARVPGHRRVLHIELAPQASISPLQWDVAIPLRRHAA